MSPFRRSNAFARDMGKATAKGRGGESALRQALARRRLEERREAQMLKQQLYDVFSDDGQS
ncbi:MAG: PA3496 family putative envelope integrity protein [Gammaproteobacteria bacterium]